MAYTTDELLRVVLIDIKKKVRMEVQLRDKDGSDVSVKETIEAVTEYISDKLKDGESNQVQNEVLPLMSQAMICGMVKLFGGDYASLILSNETTRYGILHMMTVGFAALKFIQKKGLKIVRVETPITDEDIQMYQRVNKATDALNQAALLGINPKDLLTEMLKANLLQKEDLIHMGFSEESAQQVIDGYKQTPKDTEDKMVN